MKKSYKIVRTYLNKNLHPITLIRGLTLAKAQAHCGDPETSSKTATKPSAVAHTKMHGAWFDGYEID